MSQTQKRKKNGAAEYTLLLCAPFLLFAVAIVLLWVFVLGYFCNTSPLWNALTTDHVRTNEQQEEVPAVDNEMEIMTPNRYIDETSKVTYYNMAEFPGFKWGKKWGTITIPSLGAKKLPLYNGDSREVLNYGIGRAFFSSYPGQGSNCVMCFHVNRQRELYFLEDIKLDSIIEIDTSYGRYVYKVTSKDIFESYDPSLLMRDEGDMLTIYTCYPKEGPYRMKRIAVTAMLVEEMSDPQWR